MLRRIAPETKIKKLMSKSTLSLKKTALSFVDSVDFLNKRSVSRVALETLKSYRKRIKDDRDVKKEIVDDPKLLIQRVQNKAVTQIAQEIKTTRSEEHKY